MKVFLAGIMQGSLKELKIHSQDWRERIRAIFATYSAVAWCLCGAVLVGWGIRWALRRRRGS